METLRDRARTKGYELACQGMYDKKGQFIATKSEQEVYNLLGLEYIPPELRENRGEIEAASDGALPELVEQNGIKGDLHLHTDWSDGLSSLDEMVASGMEKGYQYMAITDHSKSLKVAGGLTEKELLKQIDQVKALDAGLSGISLLTGIEIEILKDGSLDYGSDIMEQVDIIVASIHQFFSDSDELITERICKAMEDKHVKVIAHPTCRLLGKRPGYDIDFDRIFQTAVDTGTAIEINASADRLDIPEQYIYEGKKRGVKFIINTDGHSVSAMEDMKYGVYMARKGWLQKPDVINTYELNNLLSWLKT